MGRPIPSLAYDERRQAAGDHKAARRRTLVAVGRVTLTSVAVGALAVCLLLWLGSSALGYRTLVMLSGSMAPEFPTGSLLVVHQQPTQSLRAGQVLTYHAPIAGRPVVTHRVIRVRRQSGDVLVRTRGDANTGADPWEARISDREVWTVRWGVADVGSAVRWLRVSPLRPVVASALPVVALMWLLVGVWRRDDRDADT
jgi:signal peptidase I